MTHEQRTMVREARDAETRQRVLRPNLRSLGQIALHDPGQPTTREIEVLQLVSYGLTNQEIGRRLRISEDTVGSHVQHLLTKLEARSRSDAVAVGFRRGLIS